MSIGFPTERPRPYHVGNSYPGQDLATDVYVGIVTEIHPTYDYIKVSLKLAHEQNDYIVRNVNDGREPLPGPKEEPVYGDGVIAHVPIEYRSRAMDKAVIGEREYAYDDLREPNKRTYTGEDGNIYEEHLHNAFYVGQEIQVARMRDPLRAEVAVSFTEEGEADETEVMPFFYTVTQPADWRPYILREMKLISFNHSEGKLICKYVAEDTTEEEEENIDDSYEVLMPRSFTDRVPGWTYAVRGGKWSKTNNETGEFRYVFEPYTLAERLLVAIIKYQKRVESDEEPDTYELEVNETLYDINSAGRGWTVGTFVEGDGGDVYEGDDINIEGDTFYGKGVAWPDYGEDEYMYLRRNTNAPADPDPIWDVLRWDDQS